MKGADLKEFRKVNKLTQEQLGDYLGIKKSFVSTIESGKDPMPKAKLSKLLNNPYGWDTSMLTEKPQDSVVENPAHDSIVESLVRAMRTIETLTNANATLADENRMLRAQLHAYESKGGTARSAEDSSSANAV